MTIISVWSGVGTGVIAEADSIAIAAGCSAITDSAVAKGSAKTAATGLLSSTAICWIWSHCNHSASTISRSASGSDSASAKTSSASSRTSSTNSGAGVRPSASSVDNSPTRRSTWLICQATGSPKVPITTPCTASLPRLTGYKRSPGKLYAAICSTREATSTKDAAAAAMPMLGQ